MGFEYLHPGNGNIKAWEVRRDAQMPEPPDELQLDLGTKAQLPASASYISRLDNAAIAELGRAHGSH